MIALPPDVLRLLIRVLAWIVGINVVGNFILLFMNRHESSALVGLACTALGGLIGLLVNPSQTPAGAKTVLAAAGDVTVNAPDA